MLPLVLSSWKPGPGGPTLTYPTFWSKGQVTGVGVAVRLRVRRAALSRIFTSEP